MCFCLHAAPLLASHLGRARPIRHPPRAAPLLPRPPAAPHQAHPETALPQGKPLLQEAHQVGACTLRLEHSRIKQRHTVLPWSSLHNPHNTVPAHLPHQSIRPCQAGAWWQTEQARPFPRACTWRQCYCASTGAVTGSPGASPSGAGSSKASGGSPAAESKSTSSPGSSSPNPAQPGSPTGNAALNSGMFTPSDASLLH